MTGRDGRGERGEGEVEEGRFCEDKEEDERFCLLGGFFLTPHMPWQRERVERRRWYMKMTTFKKKLNIQRLQNLNISRSCPRDLIDRWCVGIVAQKYHSHSCLKLKMETKFKTKSYCHLSTSVSLSSIFPLWELSFFPRFIFLHCGFSLFFFS